MKIVLIALVVLGVGFGGEFSYDYEKCKNNCSERSGMCIDDWAAKDTGVHDYCQRQFEEKKQKCLDECDIKYKNKG